MLEVVVRRASTRSRIRILSFLFASASPLVIRVFEKAWTVWIILCWRHWFCCNFVSSCSLDSFRFQIFRSRRQLRYGSQCADWHLHLAAVDLIQSSEVCSVSFFNCGSKALKHPKTKDFNVKVDFNSFLVLVFFSVLFTRDQAFVLFFV